MTFYQDCSIGQVAKITKLTIRTIHYYEEVGILNTINRDKNGQRIFNDTDIHWLIFVKYLRKTGMNIKEIKHYRQLINIGSSTIPTRIEILEHQKQTVLAEIDAKYEQINQIDHKLQNYQKEIGRYI